MYYLSIFSRTRRGRLHQVGPFFRLPVFSNSRLPHALLSQVVRQPSDTLKVCIPAMIYIIQNNLFYVAASHLDAATFMVGFWRESYCPMVPRFRVDISKIQIFHISKSPYCCEILSAMATGPSFYRGIL